MLLANFNLANTCAPHATPLRTITRVPLARMFGGINFGDLVKKICQFAKLKSPLKFPAMRYVRYEKGMLY